MKQYSILVFAALLMTSAHAQVLGKPLSLQQSGLCNFLSCEDVREVQITPRIKFVGASAGAGAFYVDGKLAAIGKQGVWSFDPQYPTFAEANAIAKLGVGIGAPAAMKQYVSGDGALALSEMQPKNFIARNGIFKAHYGSGDFGLFLIDKTHYSLLRGLFGRDDAVAANAIVNRCFKQSGLQAEAVQKNLYRLRNSQSNWNALKGCLGHSLSEMGGMSGAYYTLPAFSGTQVDVRTSQPDGSPMDSNGPELFQDAGPYIYISIQKVG